MAEFGAVLVITGASLTGVTVIVKTSIALRAGEPSSVTVKVTSPLVVTPSNGIQVISPVESITIPAGSLARVQVSTPFSGSSAAGA